MGPESSDCVTQIYLVSVNYIKIVLLIILVLLYQLELI